MKKNRTYMPPRTEIVACEVEKDFALNVSGLNGLTDQDDLDIGLDDDDNVLPTVNLNKLWEE
ncbi:MAG: hypothetical protein IKH88_10180 [Prevotella sp.]|nr:hypothetical protein [Prevotella sp.]